MIALLQDVSDSAIAPAPTPTPAALTHLHHMLSSAVPNVWIMAGITVGLFVLVTYLLRVPHQFPLRGMVMAFTALAFAGSTIALGVQVWDRVPHRLADAKTAMGVGQRDSVDKQAEVDKQQAEVDKQPVAPLETYVPPMPGADTGIRYQQPSVNGMPSGTVWDETTNQSIAEVVKYYANDDNHPGWQVEFSAPNGIVLRRTITAAAGQLENERLSILARPNVDRQGKKTEVKYELSRRLK